MYYSLVFAATQRIRDYVCVWERGVSVRDCMCSCFFLIIVPKQQSKKKKKIKMPFISLCFLKTKPIFAYIRYGRKKNKNKSIGTENSFCEYGLEEGISGTCKYECIYTSYIISLKIRPRWVDGSEVSWQCFLTACQPGRQPSFERSLQPSASWLSTWPSAC